MNNIIEIDQKVSQKAESFAEREYSCGYEEREALNKGFYWGYKDAEKDLALTWEDIKAIHLAVESLLTHTAWDEIDYPTDEKLYSEALKKYNANKNK